MSFALIETRLLQTLKVSAYMLGILLIVLACNLTVLGIVSTIRSFIFDT